jgi:hypothetical protein
MANPSLTQLNVPGLVAPETRVFRAIQSVLAADPTLQSVALKIHAWEDERSALDEPLDTPPPAPADLPLLRMAPASNPARWETEGQHRGTFSVDLTLYVAGTHADDSMNLWHAIRTALYPQDEVRRAAVEATFAPIGAMLPRPEFTRQPATVVGVGESAYAIKSSGTITAQVYVNT